MSFVYLILGFGCVTFVLGCVYVMWLTKRVFTKEKRIPKYLKDIGIIMEAPNENTL